MSTKTKEPKEAKEPKESSKSKDKIKTKEGKEGKDGKEKPAKAKSKEKEDPKSALMKKKGKKKEGESSEHLPHASDEEPSDLSKQGGGLRARKPQADRSMIDNLPPDYNHIQEHNHPQPEDYQTLMEKVCVHHDQPISIFCESCEEPICRQCSILGPHNNQLHRLNGIPEAYRTRVAKLSNIINGNILQKKDQLLAQIHRIEYRIEEIRYVKALIERDAKAEFSGIVERLRSAEGIKIAVLQHEMAELQKDLDKINDVGNNFLELSSNQSDPVQFLLRSRNLYENIEFLSTKPFKDIFPYDLPRELSERRLQLERTKGYKQILEFKDEVVFKLISEKKNRETQIRDDMDKAANEEINEWARLTDKFANELKKYQLVCYYCGTTLDDVTVNKKCKANKNQIAKGFIGYCDLKPPSKSNANHRHFFAKPNQELMKIAKDTKGISINQPLGRSSYQIFMEVQVAKMRKKCIEKSIELNKIFKDHDKKDNGTLGYIPFAYIMTEKVGLDPMDTDKMIKLLDYNNNNFIVYEDVIGMLMDSTYIEKLEKNIFNPRENLSIGSSAGDKHEKLEEKFE